MPYIEVREEDLKRLRELAGIFEIKEVVTKILDDFLEDYTAPDESNTSKSARAFSFSELPSLSHTKFVTGSFAGIAANKPTWNGLLGQAIEVAYQRVGSVDKIAKIAPLNLISGKRTEGGYKYLSSVNVSYQGVSATYAARYLGELGKALSVPIRIEFRWRTKDEAEFPGVTGCLEYNP